MEQDTIKYKHGHKDENYYKTIMHCECGSETTRGALYNHLKSKKHQTLIAKKQVLDASKDDEIKSLKQNLALSAEVINLKREMDILRNEIHSISNIFYYLQNLNGYHRNNETKDPEQVIG